LSIEFVVLDFSGTDKARVPTDDCTVVSAVRTSYLFQEVEIVKSNMWGESFEIELDFCNWTIEIWSTKETEIKTSTEA
jgi:hypothetical protein